MRLDAYLVEKGFARSRDSAKRAIMAGQVVVDGCVEVKPSTSVAGNETIQFGGAEDAYVSRGALKLLHGLDRFDIDPKGKAAIDLGASTGGFTQVLLMGEVARVYAIDVGTDQLHPMIKSDARVTDLSPLHARDVTDLHIPEPADLIVCDVSFISLKKALPGPLLLTKPDAEFCVLVKPQFEVGKNKVGKKGVVRNPNDQADAIFQVLQTATELGWYYKDLTFSPITGPAGNIEYLLWLGCENKTISLDLSAVKQITSNAAASLR